MQRISLGLFLALLLGLGANGQSAVNNARVPVRAARVEIRTMPPELLQRFEPLHAALKPSARIWIEEQAAVEAQRPRPDLNALRAAIRQRFAASFSPAASRPSVELNSSDVDAVAFVVLMQAARNAQANLEMDARQLQAALQQLQTLRQELLQTLDQLKREAAVGKANLRIGNCATNVCQSLPSTIAEINALSPQLPHPLHLQAPVNISNVRISVLENQIIGTLDTMSEDNQLLNTDLQNTAQNIAQNVEAISDVQKSMNDTAMSIINNLK